MICNIIEEITRNQAYLDFSETCSEVFQQASCKKWYFIEFNYNSAFILPQSETVSATNGRMVTSFCMSTELYIMV